jgi:DNA polymerase-3 subunit beta
MRIIIKKNVLQAMSILASKKDVRYYLNGVYVMGTPKKVRYVATDGHILGLYQSNDYLPEENFDLIIPNEVIAKLEKNKDHELSFIEGKWQIDNMIFTPVDGKFPDYQRVLPRGDVSNEVAQFNPDFIVRFQKVGKLLVKNAVPTIAHNGSSSSLVDIGLSDFIGVMMPIRTEKPLAKTPLAFLDNVIV